MTIQLLDFPEIRSFPAGSDGRLVLGRNGRLHGQAHPVADIRAGGPDGRADAPVLPAPVHHQAGKGPSDEKTPEEEIAGHRSVRSRDFHHQEGGIPEEPLQGVPVETVWREPGEITFGLSGKKGFQRGNLRFFQQREPAGGDIDLPQHVSGNPADVAVPEPEQEAVQVFDPVPDPGTFPLEGDEKADHTSTSL